MTHPNSLPASSFVPVRTQRLAQPELLWQDERAAGLGFDPTRVFCSPVAQDAQDAYTDETRTEWADRYGGIGVGTAGGSGRCSLHDLLQIKGVGVTPLVGHDADPHHSNGTQTVLGALAEALLPQVYQAALPFGAVPTLAVLLVQRPIGQPVAPSARALSVRPFVLRPAHFMRNVLNLHQREPEGRAAPGLTRDAFRVMQASQHLTEGLRNSLGVGTTANDLPATVDAGLREFTRRLAWQMAASFAKRLPHGSIGCSNVSLAGEFMDFGMSHMLPTYRRPSNALQDPWTEWQRAQHTVLLLRQQLEKYLPGLRGAAVVSSGELLSLYTSTLEQRLAIEMAKMAGLTEDLTQFCSPALVGGWLQAMRDIWRQGGRELLVPHDPDHPRTPQPTNPHRPDLNRVLTAAAPHQNPEQMDQALAPLLADDTLRSRFVRMAVAVRRSLGNALRPHLGDEADVLGTYLAAQAQRKNATLPELERDYWHRINVVTQMLEHDFQPDIVQRLMQATVARARHLLSDLDPALPGESGVAQLQHQASCGAQLKLGGAPAPATKRILVIIDYFGRWPEWIDAFWLSCAHNPSIDWLVHTDCPRPNNPPANVRFESVSFDSYCERVRQRLRIDFSPFSVQPGQPPRPLYHNLCDLRPTYGHLHADAIEDYDYIGWCDIDLLFGNLRRFLTPQVLNANLVTFGANFCSGHFTLLKNNPAVLRMYEDIPDWRSRIEQRNGPTPWDDCLDEAWLSRLCSPEFRDEALKLGVSEAIVDRYRQHNAFIPERVTPFVPGPWSDGHGVHPEVWYWENGEVTNWRDGDRPYPYLHFMNFKQRRHIDDAVYGLQPTWGKSMERTAIQPGLSVLRIDRSGIRALNLQQARDDRSLLRQHRQYAQQALSLTLDPAQALSVLASAGVEWRDGVLNDRAGVLEPGHRRALWEASIGAERAAPSVLESAAT